MASVLSRTYLTPNRGRGSLLPWNCRLAVRRCLLTVKTASPLNNLPLETVAGYLCGCAFRRIGKQMGSNSRALDSSNLGFQLLKRSGWKEGTGLGASEQGILEPVQTQIKKNKFGIGAEKKKKRVLVSTDYVSDTHEKTEKKPKAQSKRLRKMLHEEERMKEKEFDQAFFREFWPDNV